MHAFLSRTIKSHMMFYPGRDSSLCLLCPRCALRRTLRRTLCCALTEQPSQHSYPFRYHSACFTHWRPRATSGVMLAIRTCHKVETRRCEVFSLSENVKLLDLIGMQKYMEKNMLRFLRSLVRNNLSMTLWRKKNTFLLVCSKRERLHSHNFYYSILYNFSIISYY